MRNKAFTLVELIITITILAILATIAFMSFSNYTKTARDSSRLSTLANVEKGLQTFFVTTGNYPVPTDAKTVSLSGELLSYIGTVGGNVSSLINISKIPLDPNSGEAYIYATNANKKSYQLLGYFEKQISYNSPLPMGEGLGVRASNELLVMSAYADKTKLFPKTIGEGVGILTTSDNEVITTNVDLFTTHSGTTFQVYVPGTTVQTSSGNQLGGLQMFSQKGGSYAAPASCPEGYIPVPGNPDFMQPGFCVAKYEMSYEDALTPNSCNTNFPSACTANEDWNTVRYEPGKNPVSKAGKYPVVNLTQLQAINACSSIGGHLITNNQWMTIARNIESNPINWSSGITGSGYISNGVSNDATLGCGTTNTRVQYPSLLRARAAKTGEGNSGNGCDKKRQLTLNNGEVIWDLAGNVWEHVNKANTYDGSKYDTITNNNMPYLNDYYSPSPSWSLNGWNGAISETRALYGPSNSLYGTGSGKGNIYTRDQSSDTIFLRGGDAYYTSNTGIFALKLDWVVSDAHRVVGFRCAY